MKITIITVVYNAAQTIQDCLESVAQQNYSDLEHWVLDGASTDGTQAIIEQFAKTHSYVRFISKKDPGMYHALNEGIERATGEVIGILHADDFYAHEGVLHQVAECFKNPIDAVYSDLLYVDPKNTQRIIRYWQSKPFELGDFGKGFCPPHPTLFVKRSVYERYASFDANLPIGNDVELMMRLMEKHRIKTLYQPDIWIKMRMGGISNRSFKNILKQNQVIMQSFKKNGLSYSHAKFFYFKLFDRIKQFLKKPQVYHAK